MKSPYFIPIQSVKRKFVFAGFLLLSVLCYSSWAQEAKTIDSLKDKITLLNTGESGLSEHLQLLIDLSTAYAGVNQDSLFFYADRARHLSLQNQQWNQGILALRNLGFYYSEKGNNQKALEYYTRALELSDDKYLNIHRADLLRLKGDEYYFLGDFQNSLTSLLGAIESAKNHPEDNLLMLSIAYRSVGRLYSAQHDFKTALDYYSRAVEVNKKMENARVQAITLAQLADILNQMGDLAQSQKYASQSHDFFESNNQTRWLAFCSRILGDSYRLQGKYDLAIVHLKSSLKMHEDLDDKREEAKILSSLSYSYLQKGLVNEAELYARKAQEISDITTDIALQMNTAKLIFELTQAQGQLMEALTQHKRYKTLSDSLFTLNNNRALSLHKGQLLFEEERIKVLAKAEQKVAESRSQLFYTLVILLFLGATLIPLYLKERKLNAVNSELRKKAEILKKRESQLQSANNSKNVIFSILGHDLKSPINTLHNALELYTEKVITQEEFIRHLPSFKSGVNHILLTLNNLLSWSSSQLNGTKIQPTEFDLRAVVVQNIEFLRETARIKELVFENKITEPLFALADRNQISLIVRNLLDNAIKYTPSKGKPIRIEAKKIGPSVELSVIDSGIGISSEKLEKIWTDTYPYSTLGTNDEKGTGIGLELCKEMISANKGFLLIQSSLNQGTKVTIRIPSKSHELNPVTT